MGLGNSRGGHLEVAKPGSIQALKEATPHLCLLCPGCCGPPQQAKEATVVMCTPTPGLWRAVKCHRPVLST